MSSFITGLLSQKSRTMVTRVQYCRLSQVRELPPRRSVQGMTPGEDCSDRLFFGNHDFIY
jgi:hypothetical protein